MISPTVKNDYHHSTLQTAGTKRRKTAQKTTQPAPEGKRRKAAGKKQGRDV
jgi:hypothetical protein